MRRLPLLALLPSLLAQQAPENVIRVETRLVQVSAVVHDKNGAVADLTKDDFIITEKGKPRTVSFFSVESNKAPLKTQKPLAQNVFTNRADQKGTSSPTSVTVVLLDGLNTKFEDQVYARQQVIKFLKQLDPQDRVALYALGGSSLRILNDFTDNPEQLQKVLAKYRGTANTEVATSEPEASNTGNDDLDAFLDGANKMIADRANINRALQTLEALEAIANHIGNLPGRKNLVWVSGSFPLMIGYDDPSAFGDPTREMRTFSNEVQQATRALNNANIAVYPVDARGLVGMPSAWSAASRPKLNGRGGGMPASTIPKGQDTMQELADSTGGRAFYNTNDLYGAIRKAVDDSSVSYTLGFYPEAGELDGRFHELKVQVKRKGTNVRYRKGYFAFKDEIPTDQQKRVRIQTAMWSPIEANGLDLNGRVDRVDKPQPNLLKVVISTDIRQLSLEKKDDRWKGSIDVLFVEQDKESKVLTTDQKTVTLNLEQKTYEGYLKSGMLFGRYVQLKEGMATLRIIVYDGTSGAVGSLIVPLAKVN